MDNGMNDIVFTDESCFRPQHSDGGIRVWRHRVEWWLNCCVMHRHTGLASDITVCGSIGFHCYTHLVTFTGSLNSQRYISGGRNPWSSHTFSTCHQPYSNKIMCDQRGTQFSRLLLYLSDWNASLVFLFSWSIYNRKRMSHPSTTTDPGYTTRYQLWHWREAAWNSVPQWDIKSLCDSEARGRR